MFYNVSTVWLKSVNLKVPGSYTLICFTYLKLASELFCFRVMLTVKPTYHQHVGAFRFDRSCSAAHEVLPSCNDGSADNTNKGSVCCCQTCLLPHATFHLSSLPPSPPPPPPASHLHLFLFHPKSQERAGLVVSGSLSETVN